MVKFPYAINRRYIKRSTYVMPQSKLANKVKNLARAVRTRKYTEKKCFILPVTNTNVSTTGTSISPTFQVVQGDSSV